ncbi:MAG: ABC transporter ATP-binding protein [Gammaproteobacteria bacterium]|nr:ABC transporter ATP-binding protein [Gammaproteobacteria bacterium]
MSSAAKSNILSCQNLNVAIAGRTLLRGLQQDFASGAITAVLGQNGVGKTTMLHTLAGIHPAGSGTITFAGTPLADWSRRRLARKLGLLMQGFELAFPSTVLTAVLTGRHPHIDLLGWESERDIAIARGALSSVGLEGLEERDVARLSGGEQRRLAIATVLAQQTDVILLDEPVSNLDPRYQVLVMRLLRKLADAGRTVVVSLHDVNLARAHCDYALLVNEDGSWQSGKTEQMINPANLLQLYATEFAEIRANGTPFFYAA